VSTISEEVVVDVAVLPAASTTDADTVQDPSASTGRSQDVAEPTTKVQPTDVDPFDAVSVTRSPADRPGTVTAGVLSDVMLSVGEVPASDADSRSGAPGTGDVVSTENDNEGVAVVTLPAGSATEPDNVQDPSASTGRSHEVAEPTTCVQLTEVDPFDAVRVTTSPFEPPTTDTVGVLSDVMLSVDDEPESETARRSGPEVTLGAVPSTVRLSPVPATDVLPAGSVRVPVTDQVPSDRDGRSHDDAEPTTYEHDLVVPLLVAVMVIVSPVDPPLPATAGVVSDVKLSVDEDPRSDAATRSGVPGAEGAVVSTVSDRAVPAVDWLPARSVNFAVTDQLPVVNVGMSHDDAEPATYEQVFVVAPFVAVNSTVSPAVASGNARVGVVSEVRLSLFDEPESDASTRSGADGADGEDVSTETDVAGPAAEVLPAASVRVPDTDQTPSVSAGMSHDDAEPMT
jgi:hypothetical protein